MKTVKNINIDKFENVLLTIVAAICCYFLGSFLVGMFQNLISAYVWQDETTGFFSLASIAPIVKGNIKVKGEIKKPNFTVEQRTSEKSGNSYLVGQFDKEFWASLSVVKQAILRTHALLTFNGPLKVWILRAFTTKEQAEVTINSLLLDRRNDVKDLNDLETGTYNRIITRNAEKVAKKESKGSSKGRLVISSTDAKIAALKDLYKEGLITAEVLADKIAAIQ